MSRPALPRARLLHRNDNRRVAGPALLRCDHGTLWVTLDGEVQDFVLEPGQTLRLGPKARALAMALGGEAALTIVPPASCALSSRPWQRWLRLATPGTLT